MDENNITQEQATMTVQNGQAQEPAAGTGAAQPVSYTHLDKEIACINAAVHALSDPMEREVLRLRYLDGDGDSYRLMRWREVAIRIYGDDDAKDIISAQRLHDKALLEIDFV